MVPKASRYLIKLSFLYFLTGGVIGLFILWSKVDTAYNWAWQWFSIHLDYMLFGWFLQFALGVAYWILPRYMTKPVRGPEQPVWLGMYMLNIGLLAITLGPFFLRNLNLLFPGRILIAGGALTLAAVILPRVKPFVLPPEAVAKMAELKRKKEVNRNP
jgi:hypothetical protein